MNWTKINKEGKMFFLSMFVWFLFGMTCYAIGYRYGAKDPCDSKGRFKKMSKFRKKLN